MNRQQLTAFQLKLEGKKYKEIAEQTGLKEGTLEVYFAKFGKWNKDYLSWQDEQILAIQNESRKKLRQLTTEAIKTITKLIQSSNESIALKASLEVLKRGGIEDEENEQEGHYRYIPSNSIGAFDLSLNSRY